MAIKLNNKAVEKIWAVTVDRVLPGFLTPRGTKLRGMARADARAHEMRVIAQAEEDVKAIRDGRAQLNSEGQLIHLSDAEIKAITGDGDNRTTIIPSLIQEMRAMEDLEKLQKLINLRRTLALALEESENIPDESVLDAPIEEDWFTAWREGAQRVSNEDMAVFWARILAGESARPNSYSLHTLEILRRLSRTDAELIERFAPFVVDSEIPDFRKKTFEHVQYGELLHLAELGIFLEVGTPGVAAEKKSMSPDNFKSILRCNEKAILVTSDDPKMMLKYNCVNLTNAGEQIMSLGVFNANMPFLEMFIDEIKSMDFSVQICDVDRIAGIVKNLATK